MTLITTIINRSRRLLPNTTILHVARLSTTTRSELSLDGLSRVRILSKIDPNADKEPDAIMERLRGRELFNDPYPPGSLLHRLSNLLEKSEAGDSVARAELEAEVAQLEPEDQLLFYRLRQQFMATQLATLKPDELPSPASDEEWRQVMTEAVHRFQEIGRRVQQIEADKKRARAEMSSSTEVNSDKEGRLESESDSNLQPELEENRDIPLYTDHSDIHLHTQQDVGRFFDFDVSLLPEGLSGSLNDEFALTKTNKILVRMAPYRVMSKCRALGQHDGYQPGTTVVLGGLAPGTGRSTALNYIAAWARSRPDWLTVFVPSADRFPQSGKRMIASDRHSDLFTQPDLHREWLGDLLRHQGDALSEVVLKQQYTIDGLQTLHDLVEYGAKHEDTNDLIFDVFAELKAVTEHKVMIAVDRYNVWSHDSAYVHPVSGRPLPASRLALVKCFMDLYDSAPAQGITVVSMTTAFSALSILQMKRESRPLLDVVTLPVYSAPEFDTVVAHWMKSGWLIDMPDDMRTLKQYVSALSGRHPREVFRVLQGL